MHLSFIRVSNLCHRAIKYAGGECETSCTLPLCAFVCPTIESEWLGEGQNSDVPAVVINVGIYKWQVAAVVNNRLDLYHVGIDWFIIDRAQQHTPAINKAVASSTERHDNVSHDLLSVSERSY